MSYFEGFRFPVVLTIDVRYLLSDIITKIYPYFLRNETMFRDIKMFLFDKNSTSPSSLLLRGIRR